MKKLFVTVLDEVLRQMGRRVGCGGRASRFYREPFQAPVFVQAELFQDEARAGQVAKQG